YRAWRAILARILTLTSWYGRRRDHAQLKRHGHCAPGALRRSHARGAKPRPAGDEGSAVIIVGGKGDPTVTGIGEGAAHAEPEGSGSAPAGRAQRDAERRVSETAIAHPAGMEERDGRAHRHDDRDRPGAASRQEQDALVRHPVLLGELTRLLERQQ